jgi:protein-disulfide isomerase
MRTTPRLFAVLALLLPLLVGRAGAAMVEERVLGDPAAPVTIIEYASLTCPHCAAFHRDVLPELKQRYIEPGKVKLVYRDFPLDQLALAAAVLAHCAGPERYFAFLDALFSTQQTWARAADPIASLKQIARLGGLADDRADACLADRAMQDAVLQSRLDGQERHDISSTPSLVIDGKTYAGGRDIDELTEILEPMLD